METKHRDFAESTLKRRFPTAAASHHFFTRPHGDRVMASLTARENLGRFIMRCLAVGSHSQDRFRRLTAECEVFNSRPAGTVTTRQREPGQPGRSWPRCRSQAHQDHAMPAATGAENSPSNVPRSFCRHRSRTICLPVIPKVRPLSRSLAGHVSPVRRIEQPDCLATVLHVLGPYFEIALFRDAEGRLAQRILIDLQYLVVGQKAQREIVEPADIAAIESTAPQPGTRSRHSCIARWAKGSSWRAGETYPSRGSRGHSSRRGRYSAVPRCVHTTRTHPPR